MDGLRERSRLPHKDRNICTDGQISDTVIRIGMKEFISRKFQDGIGK